MSVGAGLWLHMEMIESVLSETKQSLDQVVRERAILWEKDGCPHDRSEEYWHLRP